MTSVATRTRSEVRISKLALIAEDSALNMKLMPDLLEASGIDIILMDIQLPDVSGLDGTKDLKADPDLKSIPVVAVTSLALRGDEERAIDAGCNFYGSKPISAAKFLGVVKGFPG